MTMEATRTEVCFWHKANMLNALANGLWGQSGHGAD
jgi:hypothetical protein